MAKSSGVFTLARLTEKQQRDLFQTRWEDGDCHVTKVVLSLAMTHLVHIHAHIGVHTHTHTLCAHIVFGQRNDGG